MKSLLSVVFAALICVEYSHGSPFVWEKRAIPTELLDTLHLFEQYASASYCWNNYQAPGGDRIECDSGNCPLVEKANATSVLEYSSTELRTDVTGYLALDHTNKLILVVFRGSSTFDNWMTNIDFATTDTKLCPSCKAHRGFWRSWTDARERVLASLKKYTALYPKYKIVSVGHSLGGAIATLAAADLRTRGYAITLYSYGAPRVATSKLSTFITKQSGGNYRVTHTNDPVPRLPPLLFGFVHVSPEYYIKSPTKALVSAKDVDVLEGERNFAGNGGFVRTDFEAHRWYFGATSMCWDDQDPKKPKEKSERREAEVAEDTRTELVLVDQF